ncbi:bestrophin-like domain [Streptomyces triculaminicus]|uniref:bestrophin-like domain n=1 Tax=Streptomyces triculaminicus TaxID=2816232 RepID=UPI0037D79664
MSEWLVLAIAMAAACAVVLTITVLRERRLGDDDDPSETPDVIEYMTMMVGVVYAIVLGLAIAGVWEARNAAQDTVRVEAQALHEVTERVRVYAPEARDRTRKDVEAYVNYVLDEEWPVVLEEGELTDKGTELLEKVREDVSSYRPRDDFESQSYQPLVDQVGAADAARTARGLAAGPTMPGVVWFGLIGGALVCVGLIFTLQIRRSPRELLLAGVYSAMIAFLLFLIWDFNSPFGHSVADATGPFGDLFST